MATASSTFASQKVGLLGLEYSAFAVDGRPDLSLIIYNAVTAHERKLVEALVAEKAALAAE